MSAMYLCCGFDVIVSSTVAEKNIYNHVMSLPLVLVLLVQSTGHFLWPTF